MASTEIEMDFADGAYLFALRLPQLAELQEKRGCGIFKLYGRVLRGRYVFEGEIVGLPHEGEAYAEDLYEVIRLALIGGAKGLVDGREVAVSAVTARHLVERYVHPPVPLREGWAVAAAILSALVEGYTPPKAEPAKEPAPAKAKRTKALATPKP